jgi:hypothetical protein
MKVEAGIWSGQRKRRFGVGEWMVGSMVMVKKGWMTLGCFNVATSVPFEENARPTGIGHHLSTLFGTAKPATRFGTEM